MVDAFYERNLALRSPIWRCILLLRSHSANTEGWEGARTAASPVSSVNNLIKA
jgi:hypothetical protein